MVVSVQQAMQMLGCKERQIFYMLERGILERAPRWGKEIRIYTASVVRALTPATKKERQRNCPSPAGFNLEDIPL